MDTKFSVPWCLELKSRRALTMYIDDTIAAIATASGPGGVGIIRISGPQCTHIASALFSHPRPEVWASHHLYYGWLLEADGTRLDEGLAVLMLRPKSYTGEDVLELHCHGSPVMLRRILERALSCGARLAEPGEFTKRAFLNGRLDLVQAEGVLDLVRARTAAGAVLATRQLSGFLSDHLGSLRTELVGLKALLEAQIDFSEEDFEVRPGQLLLTVGACTAAIEKLIDSFQRGKILREGLRVAIIGKPNVGKSSLMNALLGEERAIVTPIAGTTRDAIEELTDFDGVPVVLSDTAGLREADEVDTVERLGMERTAARIADADVLLTVIDASHPMDAQDTRVLTTAGGMPQLVVLNKVDLPVCVSEGELRSTTNGHPVIKVSAKQRVGLAELRSMVTALADASASNGEDTPVIASVRHLDALRKAHASLVLAQASMREARTADLIAVDVQDALDHIGEVTGVIASEDVLDRIFSEFCIGK